MVVVVVVVVLVVVLVALIVVLVLDTFCRRRMGRASCLGGSDSGPETWTPASKGLISGK